MLIKTVVLLLAFAVPPASPPLPAGSSAVDLVAGLFHNCMRDGDGTAYCWGRGATGALGDGGTADRAEPVAVVGPDGVTFRELAPGGYHTCGVGDDMATYCWGTGDHGQLGDGDTTDKLTPVPVATPDGVTLSGLTAGQDHTCGIGSDGRAYCWGADFHGKLGNGSAPEQSTPAVVRAPKGVRFTQLSAGDNHTCGISTDAKTFCWGDGRPKPVRIGASFTQIDAGAYHTCGLSADARIFCWGNNVYSQLGDGTDKNRPKPVAVLAPEGVRFIQVTAGEQQTCALSDDNRAFCWGHGYNGMLGDGTGEDRSRPATVLAPTGVAFTRLAAGGFHTCGLGDDGRVYCWGSGDNGQLGNGEFVPQSRPVPAMSPPGPAD